jgi:hypothetical protein
MTGESLSPNPVRHSREWAARTIILLMAFSALLAVFGFFSNYAGHLFLRQMSEGILVDHEAYLSHWRALLFINRAQAVLFLVTGLVFLRWVHLCSAGPGGPGDSDLFFSKYKPVWVWFVPILNIYRPYGILRDLWRDAGSGAGVHAGDSRGVPWVLPFWWIAFLGAITLEAFTILRKNLDSGIAEAAALARAIMFVDALWFIAAVSGIAVVWKIRQRLKA